MGADQFLDEQRFGEERRLRSLTHVVVDLDTIRVYGPYRQGEAATKRIKVLIENPTRGVSRVVVRKMRGD